MENEKSAHERAMEAFTAQLNRHRAVCKSVKETAECKEVVFERIDGMDGINHARRVCWIELDMERNHPDYNKFIPGKTYTLKFEEE